MCVRELLEVGRDAPGSHEPRLACPTSGASPWETTSFARDFRGYPWRKAATVERSAAEGLAWLCCGRCQEHGELCFFTDKPLYLSSGVFLYIELERDKIPMRLKKYSKELGGTAGCTLRLVEGSQYSGSGEEQRREAKKDTKRDFLWATRGSLGGECVPL